MNIDDISHLKYNRSTVQKNMQICLYWTSRLLLSTDGIAV